MRISSIDDVAALVGLRCSPDRVRDVRAMIAEAGILLRGHYELQSGAHSEYFVRVRGMIGREDLVEAFAGELAVLGIGHDTTTVLCPESAGFAIGEAIHRRTGLDLAVVKTDLQGRPSTSLRAGELKAGASVLLVDDVATSGASLRILHRVATEHDATVNAALVLATVGVGPLQAMNDLGISGSWLIDGHWPLFAKTDCPLCKRGAPLTLSAEIV